MEGRERREVVVSELVDPLGRGQILQPVLAEIAQPTGADELAVEAETSTCPPWPQAAIRAARWTSTPT